MEPKIKNSLSIVMPVFNEQDVIETVVRDFSTILDRFERPEFVIVNDKSTDKTRFVLKELENKYRYLKVIDNDRNRGHGPTLMNAYKNATGEYIFHCDSDNQFYAADFWILWKEMERNNRDVVVGYRRDRKDPFARLVLTRLVKYLIFIMFGKMIVDSNSPFRLYRRSALNRLLLLLPDYPLIPSILLSIGAAKRKLNIGSVSVRHLPRVTNKSFLRSWKIFKLCAPAVKEVLGFRKALKS